MSVKLEQAKGQQKFPPFFHFLFCFLPCSPCFLIREASLSPRQERVDRRHACRDEGPRRSAKQAGWGASQLSIAIVDVGGDSLARETLRLESRIVPRKGASGSQGGRGNPQGGKGRITQGAGEVISLFFPLLLSLTFRPPPPLSTSTSSLSPSTPHPPQNKTSSRTPPDPRGKSPG